jgi:tRNA dimethylallyltransferase
VIDLAVLVGPTAAGKTTLGADLAARLRGEIVSADAFAVYRGLDIGTAKPSTELRAAVAHHLIDVADPRETYSAGMFMRDASAAIADIHARGRLPIVVGGTLFYVSSLLRGLFPEPPKLPALRAYLEAVWAKRPERVRRWLQLVDAEAAGRIAPADRQRSLRALEVSLASGRPMTSLWREGRRPFNRFRPLVIGVTLPREVLHARIAERVEAIFAAGLLEEVEELLAAGVPPDAHAMKAIGYRECCEVLRGRMSLDEAVERTKVATRQLAKRQITWLRGESDTVWLAGTGDAALELAVSQVEAHCGSSTGSAEG